MNRGLVIDRAALERLNWGGCNPNQSWFMGAMPGEHIDGVNQLIKNGFLYILGATPKSSEQKLLVIARKDGRDFFEEIPEADRSEAFLRILKVAMTSLDRGLRVPFDWKVFHSGSLVSFQSNRFAIGFRGRVYMDFNPEGTSHIYAFAIVSRDNEPLTRSGYDEDLVSEAILAYDEIENNAGDEPVDAPSGHMSVALTQKFDRQGLGLGVPFSVWRDSKLTADQLKFFNAPFSGPLRLRGAAGTGKTLVLCLRFIREIYNCIDSGEDFRAAFLTHAQETSDLIRLYLTQLDERGVLPALSAAGKVDVTTLHGVANEFVNYDSDGVLPISLDGAEGRKLQVEILEELISNFDHSNWSGELSPALAQGLKSVRGEVGQIALICDLIDEFASVLEAYGARDVDQIAERYLRASARGSITRTDADRQVVLEIYRGFRTQLQSFGVVSMDQFIADFGAYLNSFRWDAVRGRRGFDFVFADELHLFNKQERPILGYLLRDATGAKRVAVAYDPRQSPRSTFLPESNVRDSIWIEANLVSGGQKFELVDVFRYTPQILDLLKHLNGHFPADDLSEEWGLVFGSSKLAAGERPALKEFADNTSMANGSVEAAKKFRRNDKGGRLAVLALDPERFFTYTKAGIFHSFVVVDGRDQVGKIQRFASRPVLSMPEFVAGLQFDYVIIIDANAALSARFGAGAGGVQKFISSLYLGVSRAMSNVILMSDRSDGGLPEILRSAMKVNLLD
ncbi:UvrD-helicase domain-containing protein [Xanthomonas arboricola]|uniref:UvrD-helicase domain-containing protein n=1 Tax=Xanthomonas arboricola TaxID=56448 RepID=UPI000B2A89EF|nr:UvrD-helicase domain-containing protein [Xanthomonas arboricola]